MRCDIGGFAMYARAALRCWLVAIAMVSSGAFAEQIDPKLWREKAIGRLLATGSDYKVYTSSADANRQPLCSGATVDLLKLQDDFTRATRESQEKSRAESDAIQKEITNLTFSYRRKEISDAVYQARFAELGKRESEASERAHAESQRIQDDYQRARRSPGAGMVILYALHTPANPGSTIVPITAAGQPDPAFVKSLGATLGNVLAACNDMQVVMQHYFKDISLKFKVPEDTGEKPVFGYSLTLRNGVLSVSTDNLPRNRFSPSDPLLTLAGYQARNQEIDRFNGVYRQDYLSASKRQPGIVYKLDGYWSRYVNFDVARRAFDGDFTKLADSNQFKAILSMYASVYSARCKDHVKNWVTYHIPYQEEVSRREYMDGRVERDLRTGFAPLKIDARFDPEFGVDWPVANKYTLGESFKIAETMGHLKDWTVASVRRDFPAQFSKLTAAQVNLFFREHACTSATMTQLGENLIRARRGGPSLQAEKIRLAGADAESDPATLP